MLAYTKSSPTINNLRSAIVRVRDFDERYGDSEPEQASTISAKCGDCKSPPCSDRYASSDAFFTFSLPGRQLIQLQQQGECPLGNNIPAWERAVFTGDFEEAHRLAMETNLWPEITGTVCPDNLCEKTCMLVTTGFKADHIRITERFIGNWGWDNGRMGPIQILGGLEGMSVGIIGAGPASYYPAHQLRRLGADVAFYDGSDKPGGLVTRGLPGFKIRNDRAYRHFNRLEEAGCEFNMNTFIGKDRGFDEIAERHDAIVLATGAGKYNEIPGLKGSGSAAFIQGIPFLQTQNKRDDGIISEEFISGQHDAKGKRVAIVGAGDTAWDAVGTALRQGAIKITLLVRGTSMRAITKEIIANTEEAEALAAELGLNPREVLDIRLETEIEEALGTPDQLTSVVLRHKGTFETIPVDMGITAIGSDGYNLNNQFHTAGLTINDKMMLSPVPILDAHKSVLKGGRGGPGGGLVGIYNTGSKKVPVFAIGDNTRDGSNPYDKALLVHAVRDGRNTVPDIIHALMHPQEVERDYDHLSFRAA